MGDNDSQVGIWLDKNGLSLDRETLGRVRKELTDVPDQLARELPEAVKMLRRQMRGESPLAVAEVPLMRQLTLIDLIKGHWANLLKPLQDLQGLGVFTLASREIQIWILELDAPDWPVPGGLVRRDEKAQLSVKLDIEGLDEHKRLLQHLPNHSIWDAISGYCRAVQEDLTARRNLLNEILDRVEQELPVPVIREMQRDRPTVPYLHVNFIGTLYDVVLRKVSDLPSNPVVAMDLWEGEAREVTLKGLPLFSHFDERLVGKATSLLIEGPDILAQSSVAVTAGKSYREANQMSTELSAAISELANRSEPPAGSSCDHCWDWLEELGALH